MNLLKKFESFRVEFLRPLNVMMGAGSHIASVGHLLMKMLQLLEKDTSLTNFYIKQF